MALHVFGSRTTPMIRLRSHRCCALLTGFGVQGCRITEEDADFGIQSDGKLHEDLAGPTPVSLPPVRTIQTAEVARMLGEKNPVVVDTMLYSWGRSMPGAVGLRNVGLGGTFEDGAQRALSQAMRQHAREDRDRPVIAVGFNALRFDGYNLALRLTALGYTNVYWYRGGREAWEVAGRPETQVVAEGW